MTPPHAPDAPAADIPPSIRTLGEFYGLMDASAVIRRRAVAAILAGGAASRKDAAGLRRLLAALRSLPGDGALRIIEVEPGLTLRADVGAEADGIEEDIVFLEEGEEALFAFLDARAPGLAGEAAELAAHLFATCPAPWRAFLADRDGTVARYFGRYRSSVQSAWNAVFLARFARDRTVRSVLLTSAPLKGLREVSVMPEGIFDLAGSKGRECLDRDGRHHAVPLAPEAQAGLDRLAAGLRELLAAPQNRKFALIGSGFQVKAGQLTVARQDASGLVSPEDSARFLGEVRALVGAAGRGEEIDILDTGLDIEIMPALPGTDRGFGKAEAVRFLDGALGLKLADGPVLAAGDTEADLPMLAEAADRSPAPFGILVTKDAGLATHLPAICPDHAVASSPDALVLALGLLSREK